MGHFITNSIKLGNQQLRCDKKDWKGDGGGFCFVLGVVVVGVFCSSFLFFSLFSFLSFSFLFFSFSFSSFLFFVGAGGV